MTSEYDGRDTSMPLSRARVGVPLTIILLVASVGVAISLQGWKSRMPGADMAPHILDARALVRDGTVPRRGTLSSLGAHTPPGTTWLVAPGLLRTHDPRLFEFAGASILYVGTLAGIFLVARSVFGAPTGLLAVALFGLSDIGTFFAGSLWPRGHPFFFIWMVYWLHRWVTDKAASALGVALVFCAAGMYVFMEIAPAALLIPVIWCVYRPPVRLRPVAVAVILSLGLWSPYLIYEQARDFRDLKALLTRTPINGNEPFRQNRQSWCEPDLPVAGGGSTAAPIDDHIDTPREAAGRSFGHLTHVGYRAVDRWHHFVRNAVHGMAGGGILPANLAARAILFLGSLGSLLVLGLSAPRLSGYLQPRGAIRQSQWCTALGIVFLVAAASLDSTLTRLLGGDGIVDSATRSNVLWLQVTLVCISLVLVGFRHISTAFRRFIAAMEVQPTKSHHDVQFIAVALAVPWVVLLAITESGRDERFWWLWSLHVILLAALPTYVLKHVGFNMAIRRGVAVLLLAVACGTASNIVHVRSGLTHGWAGIDSDEVKAVDYIAGRLQGQREAAIGYQIFFAPYMADLHALDVRYKVGTEMDLLLDFKYGLTNTNRCAEGVARNDQYRVLETHPVQSSTSQYQVDLPLEPEFTQIHQVGRLRIFERARPPTPNVRPPSLR